MMMVWTAGSQPTAPTHEDSTMAITVNDFAHLGRPLPVSYEALDRDPTEFESLMHHSRGEASRDRGQLVGPWRTHQWETDAIEHGGRTVGRIFLSKWHPNAGHPDGGVWVVVGMFAALPLGDEVGMVWIDGAGSRAPVRVPATPEGIATELVGIWDTH